MDNFSILSLFWSATAPVKIIILFLIAVSIFSWTVIFQRALLFKNVSHALSNFNLLLSKSSDIVALYQNLKTKTSESCAESFFNVGIKEFLLAKKDLAVNQDIYDRVTRALNLHEIQEVSKLEKQLSMLATIGSVSPYVGLFGTVWGIMHSFIGLTNMNEQATIATVAPGIAESLIATAIGLFAAIPAVIAFNRYSSNLNFIISGYDELQQRLVLGLKKIK